MAQVGSAGHSYATWNRAFAQLQRALHAIGKTPDNTRWLIAANMVDAGIVGRPVEQVRFVPMVLVSGDDVAQQNMLVIISFKVSVIG